MVLLDEGLVDPELAPAVGAEALDQEAALVAEGGRLDRDEAVDPVSTVAVIIAAELRAVLALVVLAVLAGADRPPPVLVVPVPGDGPLDPLVEADRGPPAEPLGALGGERVAAVVAEPVGDVVDQRLVAAGELEDPRDDLDVRQLLGAADVVDLARPRRARGRRRSRRRSPR